jgi:hypothetical protein
MTSVIPHSFLCNPSQFLPFDGNYFYPMDECAKTWGNVKPLFHYSESHPDKTNPRAHADMPTDYPVSDQYDFDIELKGKDFAIRRCEEISNARLSQDCPLPTEVGG